MANMSEEGTDAHPSPRVAVRLKTGPNLTEAQRQTATATTAAQAAGDAVRGGQQDLLLQAPNRLTLPEAALLAGLARSPDAYNPVSLEWMDELPGLLAP